MSRETTQDTVSRPWYKEPWPWILMAGPAVVVVACVVTIYLSFAHADVPVAGPHVKRGLKVEWLDSAPEAPTRSER
ncbi:MAG: FixH family protein [Pigmentiphaga sp.]|nr:FixH family protein [Pigmentiphaga sp.]